MMTAFLPTKGDSFSVPLGSPGKGDKADYDAFWAKKLPPHLANLQRLCAAGRGFDKTPGALYLFSMLHQLVAIQPSLLLSFPILRAWYETTLNAEATQKVLKGHSSMGEFSQYFQPA